MLVDCTAEERVRLSRSFVLFVMIFGSGSSLNGRVFQFFSFVEFFNRLNLLLLFHATILEPYLDLSFRQEQGMREFDSATSRQITIKLEFFFQFKSLETSVCLTSAATLV